MQLWQLDVTASLFLASGRECKVITGIEAQQAGNTPDIEALVQAVVVTEDREAAIEEISSRITGASADDVAHTPFVLIGTYEAMAAQLRSQADEFGISSYVVREAPARDLEHVMQLL